MAEIDFKSIPEFLLLLLLLLFLSKHQCQS